MSLSVLVCGFGTVLLLTAIVGGGLELKELKVPKLSGAARCVAAIVGVLFVVLGIGLGETSTSQSSHNENVALAHGGEPQNAQNVSELSKEQPIEFSIYDDLASDQVTEQVTILIDGKIKGQLTVDTHNSRSMLSITVPKPGRYSYSISSKTVVNVDGELYEYAGTGQGIIDVDSGKIFDLSGSISGTTWLVTLVERS